MADDSVRVDSYIQEAPDFARPILEKIRKAFHKGCPGVEETIKWGCPHFMYKGMLGGMAAFKGHVTLGFWKSKLLDDPEGLFCSGTGKKASMCNARFESVKDVPSQAVLVRYIKQAAKLNDEGIKPVKPSSGKARGKIIVEPPVDLAELLNKNPKAKKTFDALAPSHRREYVNWINEAKREATRAKRLATTVEWLAEGKKRNWKYENC